MFATYRVYRKNSFSWSEFRQGEAAAHAIIIVIILYFRDFVITLFPSTALTARVCRRLVFHSLTLRD
jgi:hypothetical protein